MLTKNQKIRTVNFNPRLREGGDSVTAPPIPLMTISIHASAKEATSISIFGRWLCRFQSTPPRRRRQQHCANCACKALFQSTPPRRRRLASLCNLSSRINISIHASAKEATSSFTSWFSFILISIHASAKEATISRIHGNHYTFNFNPRLREGGDALCPVRPHISARHFNPRLREGGDILHNGCLYLRLYFNPRLREGGDRNIL